MVVQLLQVRAAPEARREHVAEEEAHVPAALDDLELVAERVPDGVDVEAERGRVEDDVRERGQRPAAADLVQERAVHAVEAERLEVGEAEVARGDAGGRSAGLADGAYEEVPDWRSDDDEGAGSRKPTEGWARYGERNVGS